MFTLPSMSNELRSDVRAALRRHPAFDAFRAKNGHFASRDFDNALIETAMVEFGMVDDIKAICERYASRSGGTEIVVTETLAPAIDAGETPAGEAILADTVLDQLRPFVSDKLLAAVTTALTPIVQSALKPAVEIERIVEIEVPGSGSRATMVKRVSPARRDSMSTFGKVFGCLRHSQAGKPVQLWANGDSMVPDPMYVVDPAQMALLVTEAERGGSVWLAGPAGGGKSSMPEFYAAKTGRPFVCVAFNRATETADLIGQYVLDGSGGMVWADGILTQAIRRPGTVILLDEITFAPAGMLALLQTLLSARVLTIHATGERVSVADGVVFVAADNTRGYGDETGLYVGTTQGNAALIDRMSRMLVVDYLPADLESQALANHTGAPRAACDRVVNFIAGVRKLSGFENRPMSLRRMIAFVRMAGDGFGLEASFDATMLSRLPDAEREALRMHVKANFDPGAFKAEMAGQPVPAAPSMAPNQTAARGTFTTVE